MKIENVNGIPTRMLEDVFWRNGSLFVRVAEGEEYFVYEVSSCPRPKVMPKLSDCIMPKAGDTGNYEIIAKRILPKSNLDSNPAYEQIEKYPSNEEWGSFAWTYTKWDNVVRAIRNKFYGKPFYDENDKEVIKELLSSMELYN